MNSIEQQYFDALMEECFDPVDIDSALLEFESGLDNVVNIMYSPSKYSAIINDVCPQWHCEIYIADFLIRTVKNPTFYTCDYIVEIDGHDYHKTKEQRHKVTRKRRFETSVFCTKAHNKKKPPALQTRTALDERSTHMQDELYHKRAALYIRVSTDEQAKHGFSLGEQRIDLESYAKGKGYDVAGIYADEGASARKAISRRHELQRLLKDVESGLIDIIVMKCLDRWMRSVRDFYKVQDILDAHGVALEFSQEQDYNTNTTQGRLMLNLKLSIAQHESDQTSDRIKYVFAGMRREKRIVTGRVPFGYRIVGKTIVVEPTEAEVVQYMFAEVMRGRSAYSLVDAVFQRFGKDIKYGTLLWMLRNRSYTGTMQGIEALAPAIVSEEDFLKVQEVLARHPRRKDTNNIHLFSGLIVCPSCGRRLSVHRSYCGKEKATYYQCENHYRATSQGGTACPYSYSLREERVESFLVENITAIMEATLAEMKQTRARTIKPSQTLAKVSKSLKRLNEIYVLGNITKEAYKARYDDLKKQERSLLAESAPCNIVIPAVMRGDNFPRVYEAWTREGKRAFWQGLIRRIELKSDAPPPRYATLDLRVIFFGE